MPRRLWLWGPVWAQMALIFAISSLHQPPLPDGMSDHAGHSIGYFILGAVVFRALAGGAWAGVTWMNAAWTVAASTLYGMSDEFHQMFVPGRTAAWDDVAADFRGAVLAVAAIGILRIINKLWRTRT